MSFVWRPHSLWILLWQCKYLFGLLWYMAVLFSSLFLNGLDILRNTRHWLNRSSIQFDVFSWLDWHFKFVEIPQVKFTLPSDRGEIIPTSIMWCHLWSLGRWVSHFLGCIPWDLATKSSLYLGVRSWNYALLSLVRGVFMVCGILLKQN